jgi:hypothetical protein
MKYAGLALIVVFILAIGILVPKATKSSTKKKKDNNVWWKDNNVWWGAFVAFLIVLGGYLRSIGFFG